MPDDGRLVRHPVRPLAELIAMVVLVAADLWWVTDPDAPLRWLLRAAAAAVWIASFRRWWQAGSPGSPAVGRGRAWAEAAAATLLVAAALLAWLALVREPYDAPDLRFAASLPGFLAWTVHRLGLAALQQVVLQLFVWRLLREVLGREPAATLAAAALFGAFHLPSPALAVATGLGAVVWTVLYRRSRRLLPLIVSHALLAGLAGVTVPERLFYEMQAGAPARESVPRYRLLEAEETRSLLRELASPEYFADRGSTDEGFVAGLYRDLLGRPPTAEELREQTAQVRATSRSAMAKALVTADERADAGGELRWLSIDHRPMTPGAEVTARDVDAAFDGFYDAEGDWRWARATSSGIRFRLAPEPERAYLLELECGAFAPQTVEVELNGHPVGHATFTALEPETRRLTLDGAALAEGENRLTLHASGERRTAGDDPRVLGLGFRRLRLEPLRFPAAAISWVDDLYFLEGFSIAEESLRWSQAEAARLVYPLRRVEPAAGYALRLDAGAFGRQRVEVAVNGRPVASWTLEGMTPERRTAAVDAALLRAGGNVVELRLPDARGLPGEARRLGVALVSIRLYPEG